MSTVLWLLGGPGLLRASNRERSTKPPPDMHQTRQPGTPAPGLTWGFTWQVQGSNLRRLSRRFYRPPIRRVKAPGPALWGFQVGFAARLRKLLWLRSRATSD